MIPRIPASLVAAVAALLMAPAGTSQIPGRLDDRPAAFVENVGQWPAGSRFVARSAGLLAHLEERAIALQLTTKVDANTIHCRVVRMAFEGAHKPTMSGERTQLGTYNFLHGAARHTGARAFSSVLYREVWTGVDLRVRDDGGRIRYDVLLGRRVDVDKIIIRCDGVRDVRVESDGRLALVTEDGTLRQSPPLAWQVGADGQRIRVDCRFRRLDARRYGFAVPRLDRARPLVIDPGLEWGTFLGGKGYDYGREVAVSARGEVTVAGYTASPAFPTKAGSYDTTFNGAVDVFVTRLAADGKTLVFSTYLGGSGRDWATGIAVSKTGETTVCGYTESGNFPWTKGALSTSNKGGGEGFVTRLDASGGGLVYSTYLGGTGYDLPNAVALDASGNATVVGSTRSGDFPTSVGAYDKTHGGNGDGFVSRLNATGTALIASTYVGGSDYDVTSSVALDGAGNAFVVGETYGSTKDFPTTSGAYDRTYSGGKSDSVVFKVSADGKSLLWSTLFGGNNWDPAYAIALDAAGNPTIAGETWSTDLPVGTKAYQKTNAGGGDAFVARLDPTGSKVLLATYLGGKTGEDSAQSIALDPFGAIVVSGWTRSSDFPRTPGAMRGYTSKGDGFVSRLGPAGEMLYYSTLFGASGWDATHAMALDPSGAAVLAGEVWWTDFPISPGSFDTTYNDGGDGYAARIDMLPTGVQRFGRATPACTVTTPIGITVQPQVGAQGFAYLCAGAPKNTAGLFLIGAGSFPNGVPVLGFQLHIDIFKPLIVLVAVTDANGRSRAPMFLFPPFKGARLFSQYVWADTAACGGVGKFSASDAIDLTIL